MKKFLVFLISMLISATIFAQSPNAFSYQAVVRNSSGTIIPNQNVSFRINILQGSSTGLSVYSEEHSATTNPFGLVNLEVGNGTNPSGNFSTIDWGNNTYYIKVELDINAGNNYSVMGTNQLLSVPYALYSPGNYKAGIGISISNDTIKNTLPNQLVTLTNGNGISVTGTYPDFTITNTNPDQAITLNGTGATMVTGTYPNFTINSTDNNTTYSAGTGLSLTGDVFSAEFGTSASTIAEGNHTHTQLHNQSHTMTSVSDHSANNWNLFYSNGSGQINDLSLGTSGQMLTSAGISAIPTWSTPNSGTVTSVGLSMPSVFTIANSPVISSGTLTATFASQAANTFFAAPDGTAGTPSFRLLVAADLPAHSHALLSPGTGLTGAAYNASAAVSDWAVSFDGNGSANTSARSDHSHTGMVTGSGASNKITFWNGTSSVTSSNLFSWNNSSNMLGIGTANPQAALDVIGNIRMDDGGTLAAGKVLTSDANGFGSWQTPAIGSSDGTANYIPKFVSATGLDNSVIYQNGVNLGIGTTTPSGKVQIVADASLPATSPIFEIKDQNGQTAMVVYKDSVHFWVKDPGGAKSQNKGCFAVSGKSSTKSTTNNFFYINPANNFIGNDAGYSLSGSLNYTGKYNSFIGYQAGYSDTSGYNNYFIGYKAGYSNTSGYSNIFIGDNCGYFNTSGRGNIFLGDNCGYSNTTGKQNVFLGYYAGYINNGDYNVFIGDHAGYSNTSGMGNSANGYYALYSNTGGTNNVANGYHALYNNIGGINNVAIGYQAFYYNTEGVYNVANGYQAGYTNNGDYNVFVGFQTGFSNTIGYQNTASGFQALYSNTTGNSNIANGMNALQSNTIGNYNTANGYAALLSNINGNNNTADGVAALFNNMYGSNNTALGFYAFFDGINYSNSTALGYNAAITASNQVSIGDAFVTTFFCQGAYAATSASAANMVVLSTGQILRSTSSKRYKSNITDLEINTENIYKLRPVSYNSINESDSKTQRFFGLIAEEVAEAIPELAVFAIEKDVIKGSASEKLIPDAVQYPLLSVLLLKEAQKQKKKSDEQQKIIDDLQKRIEALEKLLLKK
ncbi:MAG: tail fiber domain-containing protein [Bacteroidia bacterium]|nr:tail fiber domain-containing protein [Bacteroidia bacterium]